MMTRDRSDDGTAVTAAEHEYYVLGGGQLGAALARRLRDAGNSVRLVAERHDDDDVATVRGDPGALATLETADIDPDATVVVATRDDGRNLRIAQLVRTRFDVERVRVLVNTPDRYDAFADIGHEPVCATAALSDALAEPSE
jgi:trk system potassium uptake protein TrkA